MVKGDLFDAFDVFDSFDILYLNKAGGSTTTWL